MGYDNKIVIAGDSEISLAQILDNAAAPRPISETYELLNADGSRGSGPLVPVGSPEPVRPKQSAERVVAAYRLGVLRYKSN